jgi:hypothetical protein
MPLPGERCSPRNRLPVAEFEPGLTALPASMILRTTQRDGKSDAAS